MCVGGGRGREKTGGREIGKWKEREGRERDIERDIERDRGRDRD